MLNVGKIAATRTAGLYYVDQVARGAEDYYAGEGEAPGEWVGVGAQALRLRGGIGEDEILRLLGARDPRSGEALRQPLASGAIAGFDLTFRAPKSVSILFGIAGDEVVREIRAAHDAAVGEALGYMEREACKARRGRGGAIQVDGRGFVGAAFEHRSSRAGDPQLHTHVVIANETLGPDGRWTALDGRLLYQHARTAGFLYQAVLRAELSERLQVRWREVERGTADIEGVPRRVIDHFSQRRAEVLELMLERGEHSARAAQVATLETRRRKQHDVPIERLRAEWRARAAEHGLDRFRLGALLRRGRYWAHLEQDETSDVGGRLDGAEGLTRDHSTFSRREVVQAFAEAAPAGARVSDIEARADAFLRCDSVVEVEPVAGERRFTTREMLSIERDLLASAERRCGEGVGRAHDIARDAALNARPELSNEQRELVTTLTQSADGVQVVRAAAGTGKTRALDAAREVWQRGAVPVLGCSLSARAACELRDQAGIDSTTIARLKYGLDRGVELQRGSVLVVDEAGMVGTRDLAKLASAADRAKAKLVLVGDDHQLPEIQAGGAFRALAERIGATELHEVRRQREPWDRNALAALRSGDVEQFAREYHDRGRIVATATAEQARSALVADWWQAQQRGVRALMIAHRRSDVADLNRRARERMRGAGRLGPDELDTGERRFATGDRVTTTRNDRTLDVVNGQSGTIARIRDGRMVVDLDHGKRVELPASYAHEGHLDHGKRVELPASYAHEGHLDHGYATTAHRAQGATVDRAFVLGSDELYREWGYTALSRHRDEARFYVTASPTFLNVAPEPLRADNVSAEVAFLLRDSRAEHLAIHGATPDHLRPRLDEQLELATRELGICGSRLADLEQQRNGTRWFERGRRAELDRIEDGHRAARDHWQSETDRLSKQIALRPIPHEPEMWRARDPMRKLEPPERPSRELHRSRALERSMDHGLDLGP
jgi:conjugative relaxase-like TrwC/TraI family protein